MRIRCFFITVFCLPFYIIAQVSLSPTSVFITDAVGIESLNISNTSETAQEVQISFEFSYPGYDEIGNLTMVDNDTTKAAIYDLSSTIRAFPRTFIIQPGGQQTVRLQVLPLKDTSDGVYWTRVIVTSTPPSADIETIDVGGGVGTKIGYVFKQNVPVFYKKGTVTTGLQVLKVEAGLEESKLVAVAHLLPQGNAPFNGSVQAYLRNSNGKVVAEQFTTTVVYFEALRRVELMLPEEGLPAGEYTLELNYETQRRDIPSSDLVQAPPVKHSVVVTIE